MIKGVLESYSPLPLKIIHQLRECITAPVIRTHLKTDSIIVFVCGAQSSKERLTGRDTFMSYATRNISQYKFIMAERVFDVLKERSSKDLLSLEGELALFSDCIIIILESPGANAELGAFTFDNQLAEIVMVINDTKYKNSESFIADGPIAKVNKVSRYGPVIYANFSHILSAANEVEDRLNKIRRRAEPINLSTFEEFESQDYKTRMLLITDLIALFSPITHSELIHILKYVYGEHGFNIHMEIAVLIATGLVCKIDSFYLRTMSDRGLYYQLRGLDETLIRARVINSYHKYCRKRTQILSEMAKG